ncbi:S10 family peptidase [Rugamonas brunnea]|nr:peptidase S10 [Rugamonas brunnea]
MAAIGLALLASCGGGGGGAPATAPQTPPVAPSVPGAYADATLYASDPLGTLATPNENAAVIHSTIELAGKPFSYTATTGHLTARDLGTGQPVASFFYVAYTAGTPDAKRPLTFFYNGGPGSASLWLHLGSFGPRRLVTGIPGTTVPPLQLVDNQETLLDHSDLVFVDAIGTGYSAAVAPNANQDFWGVDRDAAAFRDFVRRYVEVNQRQASPKFLFGESYGAPRTAVLANLLETAGVQIDGLVLQSSILDYNSNCGVFSPNTISCEGYVPTYAATGAYFLRSTPLPGDLTSYVQQARDFSAGPYRSAMSGWLNGRLAPGASVTTQLFNYTGIATLTWQQNFDLGPDSFQSTVLPGQLVGRYDARVAAPTGSTLAAGGDPSLTVIDNSFVRAIASYVAGELHYTALSAYVADNDIVSRWNFQHDGKALPDTVPDLSAALTLNPAMQVLAMNGYYDLATPFHQTELDLARLGSDPAIRLRYYTSGHMSYLDDAARRAQLADLISFYNSVLAAR